MYKKRETRTREDNNLDDECNKGRRAQDTE